MQTNLGAEALNTLEHFRHFCTEEQTDPSKRWLNQFFDPKTGERHVYLFFNSSWDWLMPVVAEIEKIEGVYNKEEFLLIRDELATARIDTVYQSVVEFIETFKK